MMGEPRKKILLIEDEADLRFLYAELLQTEGYLVDQAADGDQGQKLIQQGGYDLVLLDLILPKIDGLAILNHLQTSPPPVANGPIIILTNLSQKEKLETCQKLGARGSIIKSEVTPDQLITQVKNYLSTSEPN